MRKVLSVLSIFLLLATVCYAQGARESAYSIEGKSNFSSIAVSGMNTTGAPGFFELRATSNWSTTSQTDTYETYYLWVDKNGKLCLASRSTISAYSSFPDGDWSDEMDGACTVVGGQS